MTNTLKVFIADDSFLVRERLLGMLSKFEELEVVGQAENAAVAWGEIQRLQPDAVVLDIQMPSPNEAGLMQTGIDVLEHIKSESPQTFVTILSNYYYSQYRDKCVTAGADAFLDKTKEFDKTGEVLLKEAVRRAANGTISDDSDGHASGAASPLKAPRAKALPAEIKNMMRVPYALRGVPQDNFATLLPVPQEVSAGDVLLVGLEKVGRNTRLELASGRLCNLHEGDIMAVVAGNRYATEQFEGYADIDGGFCHMLSMGGLCGLVKSKHSRVSDPTGLRVLGALGDANSHALHLRDFSLPALPMTNRPRTIVVCGTSMDSGKTYTAFSLIHGLQSHGHKVGAYKLTGTAAGRDTWSMFDAGAAPALDFIDGGHASTYLCTLDELLRLHDLLSAHVAAQGADWVVIEVADGLLQAETAALLQDPRFQETVDVWVFAAGDPLAAVGGVSVLRGWGIEPLALSGRFTQSPLCIHEAKHATSLPCLTARKLQYGDLNERLIEKVGGLDAKGAPVARVA